MFSPIIIRENKLIKCNHICWCCVCSDTNTYRTPNTSSIRSIMFLRYYILLLTLKDKKVYNFDLMNSFSKRRKSTMMMIMRVI